MATIGLSKPYYAKYSASGNTVSYSEGGLMGKAIEVNIEIEVSEDNNLYADNGVAETDRTFSNGTLTITTDDLEAAASKAMLGLKEEAVSEVSGITDSDVKKLVFDDDQVVPYLGFGVVIKKVKNGVTKWRAVILKKTMFAVPSDAATTQGESIEWQTPELSATIMRDDTEKHCWKEEATFTTEAQAETYIKHVLNITD